jgi:putative transposase
MVNERRRLNFLLFGYVLMPDHWHALICPRSPVTISAVLQNVKRVSSFRINRLREAHGSRREHQFWDRFIRHAREFTERLEYMHMNPVRKGLIEKPEQWLWSGYNNFSLDPSVVAGCPIQIDYFTSPTIIAHEDG